MRNENIFKINGFNFVCRNISKPRGVVALYIKANIHFSEINDLSINIEGEFESIFIEAKSNNHRFIVGEIYRTPGTNTHMSIERYKQTLDKLDLESCDIYLGTDHNFDYIKMNSNKSAAELFATFYSRGYLPTITKPTRITKNTATINANICSAGTSRLQ